MRIFYKQDNFYYYKVNGKLISCYCVAYSSQEFIGD